MEKYTLTNSKTIDRWIENGWEWGKAITEAVYKKAVMGEWDVFLTPKKVVPHNWFEPFLKSNHFENVDLLGLASGGAQQMPIFSALGATTTVMDLSDKQLQSEREVAEREGYKINIVKADMTERFPFKDNSFDIIFHPVSNCYIEDVYHVFRECFRVLRKGGILLCGLDNGMNFLINDFEHTPFVIENKLPFNPLKNPEQMKILNDDDGGIQFSHTFDDQIGGQLKAGFHLVAGFEDYNSEYDLEQYGIASYWSTKSIKP